MFDTTTASETRDPAKLTPHWRAALMALAASTSGCGNPDLADAEALGSFEAPLRVAQASPSELAFAETPVAPLVPTHSSFDTTDCDGVVLDDAEFSEPIVRDHRDASYGALDNAAMRPLGGGQGYANIVPRPITDLLGAAAVRGSVLGATLEPQTADFAGASHAVNLANQVKADMVLRPATLVRNAAELRSALLAAARVPQTVYVADELELDLSYCAQPGRSCRDPRSGPADCAEFTLSIPPNTTLASGRGRVGSLGARLFSRTFTGCPLLAVTGPGIRITGLRIHGPDSSIENDDPIHCAETPGIAVHSGGVPARWAPEIDNNELSSWPNNAIGIDSVMGVRVHHNLMQFNRRQEHNGTCDHDYGLGYGVVLGPGSANIYANVFDHNRHDIASDGRPGSSYSASYNLILAGAVQHSFDVHGGEDREDCTDIAGSGFVVHHNTFLQAHKPAFRIRGTPLHGAFIYRNDTRDDSVSSAFNQVNSSGHFSVSDNRTNINAFPAWFVSFGGSSFWQWRSFDGQSMSGLRAGDFDGDGAADVMRSTSSGWQWSKSGREGFAFLNSLTTAVTSLGFGDFVGGPTTDIIRATGSEWQVSAGGTSAFQHLFSSTAALSSAAFGDFEGDGKSDAFFANGSEWVVVQSFSPLVRRHYSEPYPLSQLRFGNFVGDPKLDVVRSSNNQWLVWDHASRNWNFLNSSAISVAELTFADFDGDGFTDIARTRDGEWHVSWGGRSGWQVLNKSDHALSDQLIADFNGDRKADVLSRQSPNP